MARVKRYIDTDVHTEALKRIRHVFDVFDSVAVMFSGGKDSLTVLHLVHQVAQERGIEKVNVVFRDEELIPQSVIDFVDQYRREPWVDMLYFAVPLRSKKYVLGRVYEYIQWDPNRQHVRPAPDWAITLPPGDDRVFDQYTMDSFTATHFRGRVAFMTGIRASESLIRLRASVNKLNENYITAPPKYSRDQQVAQNVRLVKPIFDWEENDVFRFFYENAIPYCAHYDHRLFAGEMLRVSTPIHAETAKRFHLLRSIDPVLYQQVVEVFPEMLAHERYFRDLDKDHIKRQYGGSMEGVRAFIEEHFTDPHERKLALERFASVRTRARRMPESYPPAYILNAFVTGAYKREILPQGKRS